MNSMSLKFFLYAIALLIIAPCIIHAQSQPNYRLRVMEYDKRYMGSQQEYRKKTYHYYSDKSSVLGWPELNEAPGRGLIPGLLYDEMTAEVQSFSETPYTSRQTFDNNGRISTRSLTFLSDDTTRTDSIKYDVQGRVLTHYIDKEMGLSLLKTNYYGIGNRLDSISEYYVHLQKYLSQTYYVYDPSGLLIKRSHVSRSPYYVVIFDEYYSYNSKGLLADVKYLKSATLQSPYPLDTVHASAYEYNNSGDVVKQVTRSFDRYQQLYTSSDISINTYDASNKLLYVLRMGGDGAGQPIDTVSVTDYSYDAFGLPHIALTRIWGTALYPWANVYDSAYIVRTTEKITAIYEHYWPTTVHEQEADEVEISIYPVPSTGSISIAARFAAPQPKKGYITDLYGRQVRSWDVPAGRVYKHTLQLDDLPAGNYIMTFEGGKEKISRQFSLIAD